MLWILVSREPDCHRLDFQYAIEASKCLIDSVKSVPVSIYWPIVRGLVVPSAVQCIYIVLTIKFTVCNAHCIFNLTSLVPLPKKRYTKSFCILLVLAFPSYIILTVNNGCVVAWKDY